MKNSMVWLNLALVAASVLVAGDALAGSGGPCDPPVGVPEPMTAALLAAGLGAVAVIRSRLRR